MLEVMSSEHTLRGPSINGNGGSQAMLGSHGASLGGQTSQSLLDQVSVREIMNNCSETVGKAGMIVSSAMREIQRFSEEKTKTDDAMDRLKTLCHEYCDQLYKPQRNFAPSKSQNPSVKQFLEQQARK